MPRSRDSRRPLAPANLDRDKLLAAVNSQYKSKGFSPEGPISRLLDRAHINIQQLTLLVTKALLDERKLDQLDKIIVGKSQNPLKPDTGSEQKWVATTNEMARRIVEQKVALIIKRALEAEPPVQTVRSEARRELMVTVDPAALAELQQQNAAQQQSQVPLGGQIIIGPMPGGSMGPNHVPPSPNQKPTRKTRIP